MTSSEVTINILNKGKSVLTANFVNVYYLKKKSKINVEKLGFTSGLINIKFNHNQNNNNDKIKVDYYKLPVSSIIEDLKELYENDKINENEYKRKLFRLSLLKLWYRSKSNNGTNK